MKVQIVDGASYTLKDDQLLCEAFGEKKNVPLDSKAKDFCVGKYGDGCGGGRIFVLYEDTVKAYHIQNDEVMVIIKGMQHTKSIIKDGCVLNIETEDDVICFNLSTMKKEEK